MTNYYMMKIVDGKVFKVKRTSHRVSTGRVETSYYVPFHAKALFTGTFNECVDFVRQENAALVDTIINDGEHPFGCICLECEQGRVGYYD